jgi:hypothetical protein
MLYTAKCYWPGITAGEFERATTIRAAEAEPRDPGGTAYLGSILFPDDELILCLFESPSRSAVKQASERAGIPCERIIESIWLAPPGHTSDLKHGGNTPTSESGPTAHPPGTS